MVKYVLKDYWNSRRQALRKGLGNAWQVVYISIMLNILGAGRDTPWSVLLAIFLGMMISSMYPNQMGKLLLLCPLTQAERKKYLYTGYGIRIVASLGIYLAMQAFELFFVRHSLWYYPVAFSMLLIYFSGINIYPVTKEQLPYTMADRNMPNGISSAWMVAFTLEVLFATFILGEISRKDIIVSTWEYFAVFFSILIEILLFWKIFRSYFDLAMEQAMNYETEWKNLGKR